MDISPRSGSKRSSEPVDDWLRTEGFFRKNAPHDATCLFRAVSEQIYLTQYYHLKVRVQCVNFMRKNEKLFEESVKMPFDNYLDQLSCVTEWGGNVEIQAMAQLYKRDFVIFNSTKLERYMATDNGYKKFINLCQLGPKVYESVFERERISTAAFCQSIMYRTLYKDVFNMSGIDEVVQTMLHDRTSSMRHDKFFLRSNLDQRHQLANELLTKIDPKEPPESPPPKTERAPFPYRVAKALDPNIYRNIDFDIWHELRREVRCTGWTRWNDSELQIGAKCLVQLDQEDNSNNSNPIPQTQDHHNHQKSSKKVPALLIGHIQEMSKDEGPVVVFIEELGEKKTVPFASLKPLLASRKHHLPLGVISPRKHLSHDHSPKYRTKWNSPRKPKEPNLDALNNNNNNNDYDRKKSDWTEQQNPTVILKPFTSPDYITNNFVNSIEARPVSIVLDNPQPLMTGERLEKEDINSANSNSISNPKPSVSPMMNNNTLMMNNNNLNQMDAYDKREVHGQCHLQSHEDHDNQMVQQSPPEQFYPQSSTPFYAPPNVMCVSEGMYPVQYYHQAEVPGPPAIQDRSFRAVNISAAASADVNGSDLPYSDPVTLRFFYNLGIESFRCGHVWSPGVGYNAGYVTQGNPLPIAAAPVPPPAQVQAQAQAAPEVHGTRREDDGRYQGKRNIRVEGNDRNDRNGSGRNSGMSSDSRGSYRGFRKEGNPNFSGNPPENRGNFEFQKKNYEDKEQRDQRDQRGKNGNRFNNNRKLDNRGRNFERNNSNTFQEYQKGRETQGHSGGFRENQGFRRNEHQHQAQGQQFQGHQYQQPIYNEVYYQTENQGFYPQSGNFYPVPFMPPQESNEATGTGNYVAVENFQQPMSPMYPQYVYPPPGVYPGVNTGGEGNWYPVGAPPGFVPYQVPVSQPPPNMVRPPTSS